MRYNFETWKLKWRVMKWARTRIERMRGHWVHMCFNALARAVQVHSLLVCALLAVLSNTYALWRYRCPSTSAQAP